MATKRAAPAPPGTSVSAQHSVAGDSLTDELPQDSANLSADSRKSSKDETMTLNVILPNEQTHPFRVNKRMPLMDLVVHVSSIHRFNPADYAVYNPQARFQSSLMPNTPVGELNTNTVKIVLKTDPSLSSTVRRGTKKVAERHSQAEPFEKSFRLEVNLPQRQKTVIRASPDRTLQELLNEVCQQKSLDTRRFTLRNPKHPDRPLDMYRKLSDEGTNVVDLVAISQDEPELDNRRFGTLSEINMEPPSSPTYEKRGFGDLFRFCRKKKSNIAKNMAAAELPSSKGFPLRDSRNISKSMTSLGTGRHSAGDFPSKSTNKRAAPRPPTDASVTESISHDHNDTHKTPSPTSNGRIRHHSGSSGFDESLALSNSPERDAAVADYQQQTPSPVNDIGEDSKWAASGKPVPAPRSATSTPDSGLKVNVADTSEVVVNIREPTATAKKKAPAPPAPSHAERAVSVSSVEVEAEKLSEESGASSGGISRQISADSASADDKVPADEEPYSMSAMESNPSSTVVTAVLTQEAVREQEADRVSLQSDRSLVSNVESLRNGSSTGEPVAVADLDAESTLDSLDAVIAQANISDFSSKTPSLLNDDRDSKTLSDVANDDTMKSRSVSISSTGSWTVRKISSISDMNDTAKTDPDFSTNPVDEIGRESAHKEASEEQFEQETPVLQRLQEEHLQSSTENVETQAVTKDPVTQSDEEKVIKALPDQAAKKALKVTIPLLEAPKDDNGKSSRSSSISSVAASISSVPPPLPNSTPPVVSTYLQPVFPRAPRSPAHVSISSFNDQPYRYRDILSRPHVDTQLSIKTTAVSREDLTKEMRIVQEAIASMRVILEKIHEKPIVSREDLSIIEETNKKLKEHYERQMVLTEKLLEKTAELERLDKREPTPPPSARERLGLVRSESGREKQLAQNKVTADRNRTEAVDAHSAFGPKVASQAAARATWLAKGSFTEKATTEPTKVVNKPVMNKRDNWITEASRRFSFNDAVEHSVSTPPPTPLSSQPFKPSAPFGADRLPKAAADVRIMSSVSSNFTRSSSVGTATPVKVAASVAFSEPAVKRRITIEEEGSKFSPLPTQKFSSRDPTRDPETSKTVYEMREERPALRPESPGKSYKGGNPASYLNGMMKNPGMVTIPVLSQPKPRGNVVVPTPPPPPPPKMSEELPKPRTLNPALKPVNLRVNRSVSEGISSSGQPKDQLMSEIRNFSVTSLRKVPATSQRTWAPKIRA